MEENVRSYEESSSKPFSFTAKYLGRYVVFQITMIVSVIAFIAAFLYAGIRVQIYGTEVAFDDTTVVIIVLLGAIGLGTLIAASIGQFFTKRKIGQVNPELQKVWSAEKKKLIASGANAVANAVLKDGVLKDAANTANSIYQTIQAFKQRRAAINGINMELERAGMDAEGKGKRISVRGRNDNAQGIAFDAELHVPIPVHGAGKNGSGRAAEHCRERRGHGRARCGSAGTPGGRRPERKPPGHRAGAAGGPAH